MVAVNPIKPCGLAKVVEKSANVSMPSINVRRMAASQAAQAGIGAPAASIKCRIFLVKSQG
jgi:hypothetical protein